MKNLRYLKPVINFLFIGLCISTISRIILFFVFKERVEEAQNYLQIFSIGLRFDLILLCYIAVLPTVLITLLPDSFLQKINKFFNFYFILFLFLLLVMELATLDFIKQYNTRPLQFQVKSDTELIPAVLNEELAKDALAHIVASSNLYKNRSYKLE